MRFKSCIIFRKIPQKFWNLIKYYWYFALPLTKIILLLSCLRPNCKFFCIYILKHVQFISYCSQWWVIATSQWGNLTSFQTHNKSQSLESRTNTNGLCSTSTLTWVNINSKYFDCVLFCVYVYGKEFCIHKVNVEHFIQSIILKD